MANGEVVVANSGVIPSALPQGYQLIGAEENYLISTKPEGEVLLSDKNGQELFNFKLDVRAQSGSYNGKNLLALLLGNNEILVIDIKKSKIVFKEKSKKAFTTTSDIASPLFADGLILFPTLDGKIVVVDEKELKFVRDFIIGQQQFFSNILFLKVYKDRIIAATNETIYSIGDENIESVKKEVRFLYTDKENLFLLTIDGNVVLLDENLQEYEKKKFDFARFVGVSDTKENLYITEHSGYVIKLDKKLQQSKIYWIPDDIDDYIFMDQNKIYYSKKIIVIE
ncbi:MAG: hypothetical protein OIF32_08425 [Campylobacterales bacterium]|nr:hypothetical protein [Campylobacterales bacterium]